MGVAGAQDGGLEHARHPHVGDEPARSRREPIAAETVVGFADHGITLVELRGPGLRPRRCSSRESSATDATKSIDSDPGGRILLHPGGINMHERIFGIIPPMTPPFRPEAFHNAGLL